MDRTGRLIFRIGNNILKSFDIYGTRRYLRYRETMNELKHLPEFIAKMEQAGLPPVVINTFVHYYRNIVSGDSGMICELDIEPVAPDQIESAENLSGCAADGHRAFPSAVRLILNGGLGTSMGLTGANSLL